MARQTSVLSCPISGLVPAELAPGRKKLARRNDGAISGIPPSGPFISPSRSREPGCQWPGGGGLLLPHFPLQNAAPPQLHTPGMCCHSPPHKDFEPFVGGRAQVLPPNIRSYSSSNRRRNNSRFSSSSRVRIMWNVVCSC